MPKQPVKTANEDKEICFKFYLGHKNVTDGNTKIFQDHTKIFKLGVNKVNMVHLTTNLVSTASYIQRQVLSQFLMQCNNRNYGT